MVVALTKNELLVPFVIGRFEKHQELKEAVLSAINEQKEFNHLIETNDSVDITRCDWYTSRFDINREWVKLLINDLTTHMTQVTNTLGYGHFKIQELWFQQYETNSVHGWHVHGSNWTNVYFLELPEGCPKTQYINPYTQTGVN